MLCVLASANAIANVNNKPIAIEVLLKITIFAFLKFIISSLTSNHSFCKRLIASVMNDIRHSIPCQYQAKCVSTDGCGVAKLRAPALEIEAS